MKVLSSKLFSFIFCWQKSCVCNFHAWCVFHFQSQVGQLKNSPWFHGPLDKKIAESALKSFSKVCFVF